MPTEMPRAAPRADVDIAPPAGEGAVAEGDAGPLLMRQIIGQSPIGIAVIDFDGVYIEVNAAYCATYGYAREEMLGRSFLMVFPAADQARVLELHQRYLTGVGELKGEWSVVRRDGALLDIISESARVPGDAGRTRRLVYVVDITERKRMELALKSSRFFLQSVLDGLTAHVCVLDDAGVVVMVNQPWRDFAKANGGQAELVHEGASYLRVCERAAQASGPAQGKESMDFLALLREVLAGRRLHFEVEYPCHSPTEERWFLARVSRIEGGGSPRVVVAHDNVSAIKRAQQALRDREAALLDLAASIPGAMFRLQHGRGDGWHFVYFSPGIEALLGVTPVQACTDIRTVLACIAPADKALLGAALRSAMAAGGLWEHEFRIVAGGEPVKWIHAEAQLKTDEQGEPIWTGVLTDVSDRKRIEAALLASEMTYRTLFETVPQGIVYHDATGRISSANPAAQRILGLSLDELCDRRAVDPRWDVVREDGSIFPGDQLPAVRALQTGRPVSDIVLGVNVPDRGRVWILVNATPLFTDGRLDQVYASFEDITQRVLLSRELARQANSDHLTDTANRRCLMDRLGAEFERTRRHPSLCCSVLALDIDHFKRVNDHWGHAVGDAVLVHLTRLMRHETRGGDVVARTGGEEFTLLMPDTEVDEAMALAERLRCRIEATPLDHGANRIAVTVSIGVGRILAADGSPDDVLVRADRALYQAKAAGRNAVRAAPEAM